jgi:hypothetical protein
MTSCNGASGSRKQEVPKASDTTDCSAGSDESASMVAYIADMSAELASLAGSCNQPMLAYFLNLARVEAELRARKMMNYDPVGPRLQL